MVNKIFLFLKLPLSRQIQLIHCFYFRLRTRLFYFLRLKKCGKNILVMKPLFWTPEYITIGDNCLIWAQARIEGISRYGTTNYSPSIILGDNVTVQQRVHITAASELLIESGTTISFDVYITDIDHRYDNLEQSVYEQELAIRKTKIGKKCFIGAGAKILAGTELGEYCIVGANSVVRGAYPAYTVVAGVPAVICKRYDFDLNAWRKTTPLGDFI